MTKISDLDLMDVEDSKISQFHGGGVRKGGEGICRILVSNYVNGIASGEVPEAQEHLHG